MVRATQFDKDGDGQIEYDEFSQGIMEEKLLVPPKWATQL